MNGLINVHSHILPGIDDGCEDLQESLETVRAVSAAGFAGTICTPHIWPELFPDNLPENVARWTAELQRAIDDAGIKYRLWPGGELRLHPDIVPWFQRQGAPTLANSNRVLVDFWLSDWPEWIDRAFDWLLDHDYQPILAHPERIDCPQTLHEHVRRLTQKGVWLQGNFRCMTGADGPLADRFVREFLRDDAYHIMALDTHGPYCLQDRLDGMHMVAEEFGPSTLRRLAIDGPARIFESHASPCRSD